MERIPAASAMDWSVDLDRGLRSRHHATRVGALDAAAPRLRELCACAAVPAPAPVASAYGVLPGEARVFAETMLLRLATEFRTAADVSMRARVVRTLLAAAAGARGVLAGARVADPDQLLRRVKAVYDTGSARDRALALRVFGCLAEVAEDSVHVRSLILSSLGASTALEIGKQMVLGSLEDVFKSEMLYSLSRLIFCGKASGIHHFNGSELSKLLLAVESSLDYPSLEMQVEPFQTSAALEELRASNGNVELLSMSAEASLIETDIGTRSKQFEHRKTAEMVEFNSKLLQYIRRDLTKGGDEKDSQSGLEMVTSFASFEPADSGQGFSACLLDVSSFSEGSYQIKWHACYVDEKGSYFSLLPLNDGAVFSVRKS
nr:unnamed protein product [Digitaria exilis]